MPFLKRLGIRRHNSTTAIPPGDTSDGEVDLDVFNPFEQSDMGITADGKPIGSFSSGSAYTVVDSPRLTMDDFLRRAPNAVADGRRSEARRAVTLYPAASIPRESRVTFSSDPELRRVAAASSLHRHYRAQTVPNIDLNKSNSTSTQEQADVSQRAQTFPEQKISSRRESNARSDSLPEDEYPDRWRFSVEYETPNISERSLGLGSHKSRSPVQGFSATATDEDESVYPFSDLQNQSSIHVPVPSFQRVAGYRGERPEGRSLQSITRRDELFSIPSRPYCAITRRPDPPRSNKRNGITPEINRAPEATIKRGIEVTYMRRTHSLVVVHIKKEDPKFRQERILSAATKLWSFWGSINRVGGVGANQQPSNLNQSINVSNNESEHSADEDEDEDEDRTAAFRSIEHADQQTRSRILDAHLEQIIEAATVDIKDKDVRRTVQIVDGGVRRVYSRRGLIESAREEVRISVSDSVPKSQKSSKGGENKMEGEEEEEEEKKQSTGRMYAFMTRVLRRGSRKVSGKTKG